MPKAKPLDAKQERLIEDLEKGEKTVDLIFQDHEIPTDVFDEWLASRSFMRAIENMRGRTTFRLEQELVQVSLVASARLHTAVRGSWQPSSAQVQAMVNAVKLCQAIVRNPQLKREAARAAEAAAERRDKLRAEAGLSPGYHPNVTPERAQALLLRLQKRRDRDDRLDRDQDENGNWMSAD